MPPVPQPVEERFFDKIFFCFSGCWLWTLSLDKDGYGRFGTRHNKWERAHRWAYEHFVGPIPDELTIDHLCKVRNCVNPKHLRLLTRTENTMIGNSVPALNARKTHCKLGHEFSKSNTAINRFGHRICKTCEPNFGSKHFCLTKTHCKNGHEYNEVNTHKNKKGHRRCRVCDREKKARKKLWQYK